MGVDCKIHIPSTARINDVVAVMSKLLRADVKATPNRSMPECADIDWACGDGVRESGHVLWHWEPSSFPGHHLMMPRSTPEWIAIGFGVIRFFGGMIDCDDCDECYVDEYFVSQHGNTANDGEPYDLLQRLIEEVEPLSKSNVRACKEYAAYK